MSLSFIQNISLFLIGFDHPELKMCAIYNRGFKPDYIGNWTVHSPLLFYVLDHQDRELNGTGGYLGSVTVPRPLSRSDTHPQAKLKTFETKMAAIAQSARSQRSYGKNGKLSIVQLPMPIPTSFLVSGVAA